MKDNQNHQGNNIGELLESLRKKRDKGDISQNEYFFHAAEALRLLAGQTELNWQDATSANPGDDVFVKIMNQYDEKEMAKLYTDNRPEFRLCGVKGMDEYYQKHWKGNEENISKVLNKMWDIVRKDISPELLEEVNNLPKEIYKRIEDDCDEYISGLIGVSDILQSVWDFIWQDEVAIHNPVVAAILKMKLAEYETGDGEGLMMKMAILSHIYSSSPRNHETQEDEYWGYDNGGW